jgi:hypothetical protein
MSDYRDPRDPVHRDPLYTAIDDPAMKDPRADSFSPGTAAAWFVGIALFVGILIFAFGSADNQQVAGTDTTPPATDTRPAPNPAPTTPPAAVPPAPTPTAPAQ